MNSKKVALFFAAILVMGVVLLYSLGSAQQQGEKLVLYNNFAYYEQAAKVGGTEASFELPSGVETDSVKLRLANGYVVSQYINAANYTDEAALLKSYVGKQVSIYDTNSKEIKGTLVKYDGKAYVQTADGLFVITPSYSMLPGFNGNVSDQNESVVFKLSSSGDAKLTYLLDSISWRPDYTLYLNGGSGTLSLDGAVTNSAKEYGNVSLSLFYGQVKRVSNGYYYPTYNYAAGDMTKSAASAPAPSYTPQAISEYYKFDLGDVYLPKGESAFSLFEKKANNIDKTFEMQVSGYSYGTDVTFSPLAIKLGINNSASNGLGVALPAGKVRVMDENGFVGEDNVAETPVGEEVKLYIGDAFDVVGASKLINQSTQELVSCDPRVMAIKNAPLCINERNGIYTNTYTYEATVKNKKSESVDVVLYYNTYGDWVMVDESMPSEKVSQSLVQWRFSVPANSERTLSFTLRQKTGAVTPPYYTGSGMGGSVQPAGG